MLPRFPCRARARLRAFVSHFRIPILLFQQRFGNRCFAFTQVDLRTSGSGSFRRAAYQKVDILAVLTDKQREVMLAAFLNGYYDYPKKISSVRLCGKVGISKPTLLQHMRKAEGRILKEIMTGYFKNLE
jgi:hypothetical protein